MIFYQRNHKYTLKDKQVWIIEAQIVFGIFLSSSLVVELIHTSHQKNKNKNTWQ